MTAPAHDVNALHDMPDADYFAAPALSQSTAKRLLEDGGPARWKWEHDHGRPPNRAFDFGRAAHRLVLGKGQPLAVIPDELLASNGAATTKAAREWTAQAEADGCTVLKRAEADQIEQMAEQLHEHPEASAILTAPHVLTEQAMFAPLYGVDCKAKLDIIVPDGPLADYKTAVSAAPARFAKTALDYGYHLQSSHYALMARELGVTTDPVRFIVQEKAAPYLVSVVQLEPDAILLGEQRMAEAAAIWKRCWETGEWPGYPTSTVTVDLPAWAYTDQAPTRLDPTVERELLDLIQ